MDLPFLWENRINRLSESELAGEQSSFSLRLAQNEHFDKYVCIHVLSLLCLDEVQFCLWC